MHSPAQAAQTVHYTAPAKINLALHVTGRRDDGYHLLDMLVVFANYGDRISIQQAAEDNFSMSGRFANGIAPDGDNLVIKARDALRSYANRTLSPVSIHLEKNLPVASGIGGGSSDAAATLLALNEIWQLGLEPDILAELGLKLGADLPICLHGAALGGPLVARGIGEQLTPIANMPSLPLLLVNDGTAIATPDVFRALTKRDNGFLPAPIGGCLETICTYLGSTRNDLLPAALTLAPQINDKLDLLRESGAIFTQMSGSGATCFAIYKDQQSANAAASHILEKKPDWFVIASHTAPSAL
ncbi:4-(cytidine 5'-diphospho)-2-C-methyl-D-erythritol kinase [Brucella gallinifaecis]|uniref:4-diphosphocytidyl-2-C-methyl-D-erythritol kinase n=1 Tax=Brucella gallinifaecis TaxID=215590 RepID=A0A502BT77_9HYPH|nr:4-(cytidine 5'-diphospho)-2-C-methyl-D-erythritol kinase [Brucella gallinifaecis]TPF76203.1 4-(cytidine 5'-diphospho)-2-C-methyl-D-erythritol kinase [Brucella gallinifaecis]